MMFHGSTGIRQIGIGSSDPFASVDGSLNAPAGPAQFPHILDINSPATQTFGRTITIRPPWKVSGVDYAVGIDRSIYPTNASLKNPSTILNTISGASGNNTSHIVTVTGNNVVLDGYDFSLNGGWMVETSGGSQNLTISNCNFAIGTNAQSAVFVGAGTCTNITITKCVIDGGVVAFSGGAGTASGVCSMNSRGTTTFTYNYFVQSPSECMVIATAPAATGDVWVLRWNAIGNAGANHGGGSHGDWIQMFSGASAVTTSFTFEFNLCFQFAPNNSQAWTTQGISTFSANSGTCGVLQGISYQNNTHMGTGVNPNSNGPFCNDQVIMVPKSLQGNAVFKNNYFDSSLCTATGTFQGNCAFFGSDFGSATPAQGVQQGTLNGTFPPSSCYTTGAMPAGNLDFVTGIALVLAPGSMHLSAS